uniref:Uncharacterized protein n=1 Tax=Arion vulgaris TaxID=1028688 RepID=A0A0B7BLP8_9EUPU
MCGEPSKKIRVFSISQLRKLDIPICAARWENHERNPSRYINQHSTGVVSLKQTEIHTWEEIRAIMDMFVEDDPQ